ncbi:hypothetical protein HDV00_001839 [Rhizophlyctis rosea]|nr:hypothetical protein HDV00_001839 [Rhizophlyctis rosea]
MNSPKLSSEQSSTPNPLLTSLLDVANQVQALQKQLSTSQQLLSVKEDEATHLQSECAALKLSLEKQNQLHEKNEAELRSKLNDVATQVQSLQNQLSTSKQLLSAKEDEAAQLHGRLEDSMALEGVLQGQINELRVEAGSTKDAARAELLKKDKELCGLRQELVLTKDQYAEQRSAAEFHSTRADALELEGKALNDRLLQLHQQMEESKADRVTLQSQFESLIEEKVAAETQAKALSGMIIQLEQEVTNLVRERDEHERKYQALESKIKSSSAMLDAHAAERTSLQDEVRRLVGEVEQAREGVQMAVKDKESVEHRRDELDTELRVLQSIIEDLREEKAQSVAAWEEERSKWTANEATLTNQVKDSGEQLKLAYNQIEELRGQLESSDQQARAAFKARTQALREIEELRRQQDELEEMSEKKFKVLQKEKESAIAQAHSGEKVLHVVTEQLAAGKREIEHLRGEIEGYEAVGRDRDLLAASLDGMKEERERVKRAQEAERSTYRTEVQQLRRDKEELATSLESTRAELEAAQTKTAVLGEEAERRSAEFEEQQNRLATTLEANNSLEKNSERLRAQLEEVRQAEASLRKEYEEILKSEASAKSEARELQAELDTMRVTSADASNTMEELENRVGELQRTLEEKNNEIENIVGAHADAKEEAERDLAALRGEVETLQSSIEEKSKEVEDKAASLIELFDRANAAEQRVSVLEGEMGTMGEILREKDGEIEKGATALAELTSRLEVAESRAVQLEEMETLLRGKELEVENKQAQLAELNLQLAETQQTVRELETICETVREELDDQRKAWNQERADLKEQLDAAKVDATTVREMLIAEHAAAIKEVMSTIDTLRVNLVDAQNRGTEIEAERDRLEREVRGGAEEVERVRRESQEAREAVQIEIAKMAGVLIEKQKVETKVGRLSSELQSMKEQSITQTQNADALIAELEGSKQKVVMLEERLRAQSEQADVLANQAAEAQRVNELIAAEGHEANKKLVEMEGSLRTHEEGMVVLKQQLEDARKKLVEREGQLAEQVQKAELGTRELQEVSGKLRELQEELSQERQHGNNVAVAAEATGKELAELKVKMSKGPERANAAEEQLQKLIDNQNNAPAPAAPSSASADTTLDSIPNVIPQLQTQSSRISIRDAGRNAQTATPQRDRVLVHTDSIKKRKPVQGTPEPMTPAVKRIKTEEGLKPQTPVSALKQQNAATPSSAMKRQASANAKYKILVGSFENDKEMKTKLIKALQTMPDTRLMNGAAVSNGKEVFPKGITHVITDKRKKTLKTFGSALTGTWLINDPKWVLDSVERKQYLPEKDYEGFRNLDVHPFEGKSFFITDTYRTTYLAIPKYVVRVEYLAPLIECGNGRIVDKEEDADTIFIVEGQGGSYEGKETLTWNSFIGMIPLPRE